MTGIVEEVVQSINFPRKLDGGLWGKLDGLSNSYSLLRHLLDTSASAQVLWDRWLRPGLRTLIADVIAGGDEQAARSLVATVAGLHDVGKANKVFQGQLFNDRRGSHFSKITAQLLDGGYDVSRPEGQIPGLPLPPMYKAILRRHEAVGMFTVAGKWPTGSDTCAASWASTVVGGHHGRFHPRVDSKQTDTASADRFLSGLTVGLWGEQQQAHHEAVMRANSVTEDQLNRGLTAEDSSTVIILLTGLVMLADWLASDEGAVLAGAKCQVDPIGDPSSWVDARREYFVSTVGETLGIYESPQNPLLDIMGPFADSLSPLQKAAQEVGRGLWIATETTGAGKTEAAMLRHVAIPGEGIMFALPTRATTDAMFERIGGYFAGTKNAASLLHAHRTLNAFYSTEAPQAGLHSTSWLTDTRNALFAPVAVGTCDQVLLGGLKQKNTPVRLLALANRHIVIDEVHTFDHYQAALLEELLTWWGKTDTRVTLLSASLATTVGARYVEAYSGGQAKVVADYPGYITVEDGLATSTSVQSQRSYSLGIRVHQCTPDELIDTHVKQALAFRQLYPDARIAVVVNQVDRAIEIGRLLAASGNRTIVLHSRMAAGHRTAITRELHEVAGKNSVERGVFVVGTQLIESSLDLDFDFMISDLAPAPSLIQRAGRLWRSTPAVSGQWGSHRFPRPSSDPVLDVIAVTEPDGSLASWACLPYLPGELNRTLSALSLVGDAIKIPFDVQHLVDAASFDPFDPANITDEPNAALELIAAGHKLASAQLVVVPFHLKHRDDRVLRNGATFRQLAQLTERDELADSSTRMVEQPSFDCFLVDTDSASQWAWRGTVEAALYSKDRNVARAVLRLTFPLAKTRLSGSSGIGIIPGYSTEDDRGLRGPLQRNLVPVRLLPGASYDDVLGLLLPTRSRSIPSATNSQKTDVSDEGLPNVNR
ncbi:MAG: CRISPR-associated helicase Cas3' [Actinomycetales bacterium]|nr:CRISPR-associated helicase Cas3' [Actinomycetales bacterium]